MYSVFGPGKAFKGWGFIDFDFTNDIVSEQDVLKKSFDGDNNEDDLSFENDSIEDEDDEDQENGPNYEPYRTVSHLDFVFHFIII